MDDRLRRAIADATDDAGVERLAREMARAGYNRVIQLGHEGAVTVLPLGASVIVLRIADLWRHTRDQHAEINVYLSDLFEAVGLRVVVVDASVDVVAFVDKE